MHWKEKKSIKSLSDSCGISRDTFDKNAKTLDIKLRSIKDAAKITNNRGKKHWAFGLRKENSTWAKKHSVRMKKNNPCSNPETLRKKQETTANTYRKNPLEQEKIFGKILRNHNIKYEDQHPIGAYIIDFFIPNLNLCIEIDSTFKWGTERRRSASIKDEYLTKLGFKILHRNRTGMHEAMAVGYIPASDITHFERNNLSSEES